MFLAYRSFPAVNVWASQDAAVDVHMFVGVILHNPLRLADAAFLDADTAGMRSIEQLGGFHGADVVTLQFNRMPMLYLPDHC